MATLGQSDRIIELLRDLYVGASNGLFGNAVFFDEQPITAKPNDVSVNTVNGIITQYDGTNWIQVADLSAQSELNAHINDAIDAHDATAISYDNSISGLLGDNVQDAIDEVSANRHIDGGFANSVYLSYQLIDGGTA